MENLGFTQSLILAQKKITLLTTKPQKLILAAVLAGAYVTIVGLVYWSIQQNFAPDPLGKFIASMFFGTALGMIVFTGAELFTGNHMYMTISTLSRKNSFLHGIYLWIICWVGNFIGAILVSWLLFSANALDGLPENHALLLGAHHKMTMAAPEIFFKAILANWIVCLAVWMNLQLREEIARLMVMILVVFIFSYLGFEHSVANMGTLSMALFADSNLPLAPMLSNLLWSSLGNIVGGALFTGLPFWYLHHESSEDTKRSS